MAECAEELALWAGLQHWVPTHFLAPQSSAQHLVQMKHTAANTCICSKCRKPVVSEGLKIVPNGCVYLNGSNNKGKGKGKGKGKEKKGKTGKKKKSFLYYEQLSHLNKRSIAQAVSVCSCI